MRVDQQHGDDEREHDERNQMVHFRRNERENGEAAPCDHRGQRYVVRNHQHEEPDAEAEQHQRGVYAHDGADERRHALAAAESGEDREDMPQNGGEYGDEAQDVEPRFVCAVGENAVIFHQVDDRHGDESLQHVQSENRQGRAFAQYAQHVGRAGVFAAVFADVDAVIFFADPYGARNRTQQIGDDNQGRGGVICQNHSDFSGVCIMQI